MPLINSCREEISDDKVRNSIALFKTKLNYRLKEKGRGSFASSHEILGIIQEEVRELEDAIRTRASSSQKKEMVSEELLDIAVGCVFGVACINDLDWL